MNRIARFAAKWWLNRKADTAILLKRYPPAIRAYRAILDIDPADRYARACLGNLLAESGRRAEASAEFERLVGIAPDDADAWFNLGFLQEQRDDLDAAERSFRKAVELRPKLDRAWYGLGLVLIRHGRLEEAVVALKKNTELQPFSPYGFYQLAMTCWHLGRADQARKIQEHLRSFEPRYAATLKRDLERTEPAFARAAAAGLPVSSPDRKEVAAAPQ